METIKTSSNTANVSVGPAGETAGVLARYNFRNKAVKHLPVLDANLSKHSAGPVSVVIHPTNACNAKCPMCRYADLRETNETIPLDIMTKMVTELGEMGTKSIIFSGGGEPIIYNGLADVIKVAASYGIKIGMVTNFIRVGEKMMNATVDHLSWVRISVNAASAEAYRAAQGMDPVVWDMLLSNMKKLVMRRNEKGTKLVIGASFIVQKSNFREVYDFVELCTEIGVDYVMFRPVQRWSPTASLTANSLALTKEDIDEMTTMIDQKLKALKESGRKVVANNLDKVPSLFFKIDEKKDYPACFSSHVEAAVGGDGIIYPCCQHVGNPMFKGGSILEKSFKEHWMSPEYKQMTDSIVPEICPPCRYHFYNTVFNAYTKGWKPTEEDIAKSSETPDSDFL